MNRLLRSVANLLLMGIVVLNLFACKNKPIVKKEFDFNELKKTANLVTLKCHFNNVAKMTKPKNNLIFDNSRKALIEYQGDASIGIDADMIQYDELSKTMIIPSARVILVDDDTDSYEYYYNDEGIFKNKFDDEAIKAAINESLAEIKNNLSENKVLLRQAQLLAQTQLKNLIDSIYTIDGKEPDINYTLE